MKRNLVVMLAVTGMMTLFILSSRFLFGSAVPPVDGYLDGQAVRFIHTEASDPKVAELLTEMKGSPVIVVPALARVADEVLANVFVFTNGVSGNGPFEYQNDVFDHKPNSSGYSPLRRLNLVTWKDPANARKLTSATEVAIAAKTGELSIEQPNVVINMPLVSWPGGQR
jgi:hypothetical protein